MLVPGDAIVGVALFGWAHMHSEVAQRAEAVMDPLTQMLNRKALVARAAELAQQTALTRQPVGVVLGDLDHFKRVNDTAGHQVGDAVLRDVAFRWRLSLRAYEMAYRLGGEEFLVLLPGATVAEAEEVAERLRAAIGAAPIAGQDVTMSFGVAASADGEPFDFDALYAQADAALYRAKRGGRDRVCGGPGRGAAHAEVVEGSCVTRPSTRSTPPPTTRGWSTTRSARGCTRSTAARAPRGRSSSRCELLVLLACVARAGLVAAGAAAGGRSARSWLADRLMARTEHAELVYAAAWSFAQVDDRAAPRRLTGGPDSPLLMWLGIPSRRASGASRRAGWPPASR